MSARSWACLWPRECLGKQEVHLSEAPKRSLRELQDFLFRFPRFRLRVLGFGLASGHGNAWETTGVHLRRLGTGLVVAPGIACGQGFGIESLALGPGRQRRGRPLLGNVWLLYHLQGEREVPFRASLLFGGNLVSGAPADFTDFAPGEQKRGARMRKMRTALHFCKEDRGGVSGMLRFLRENGLGANKC